MPQTPAEVVRAVAAGVGRLVAGNLTDREREDQLDQLANLYAEHTDVRHPFRPTGDAPLRTRAELREHFAGAPARTVGVERYEAVGQVHETGDPEVVVHEFDYVGTVSGQPFSVPCIFVCRVRDGMIVESRDYGHHIGLARVFGRLDDLVAELASAG